MIHKTMTDIIGEDYNNWENGNCIILNGSTGSGKTYFVLNPLAKYASSRFQKILFLCSRTELAEDIRLDVQRLGLGKVIEVKLYQSIQTCINKGWKLNNDYTYIVYDEAHYLFTDGWNKNTDLMFNFFKENMPNHINILMSGTGDNVFGWLKKNNYITTEYVIPYSYSYVDRVIFYYKDETVEDLFNNLKENEKIIFFSRKLDRAYELFNKYKDKANFICSKHCKYKEQAEDCIKIYNKDLITFEKPILIATTALDVGVTIKDKNIKYIITDLLDINSLQQCLGRKRVVDDQDKCIFYIKKFSKKSLNGFLRTLMNNILNDAEEYYYNREKFIKESKFSRVLKSNKCFYFSNDELDDKKQENSKIGEINFNYWTYIHYLHQKTNLEKSIENGFDKVVLKQLGESIKEVDYMEYIEKEKKIETLEDYLDSIVGQQLWKEEQKELINKINLRDSRKRQQKSYELFNEYFKVNGMPYSIIAVQDKRRKVNEENNPNFNKTYWEIIKSKLTDKAE